MPQVGDWIFENCVTVGQGALTLVSAVTGFSRFADQINPGTVWYSIEDNGDREVGIGTFDGVNTIQRTTVQAVLRSGVYETSNPSPLFLSGASFVACTFNADAYESLFDHLGNISNPHNVTADQIPYDSSQDPVTNFTNLQEAMLDQSESIEERVATKSGIKFGGIISQAGPALVNITAGEGLIIDSYTDPSNTTVTPVTWTDKIGVALNIGVVTTGIIRFGIDTAGNVIQFVGGTSPSQFRQYVILGVVYFINSVITEVLNAPSVIKQTATDTYDLMRILRIINGLQVGPVTGALSVWLTEGSVFYPGINWTVDRTNPNLLTLPQEGDPSTPISFYTIKQDGTIGGPISVMPAYYNPSGATETVISGSTATIHRLYSFGVNNREYVLLIGQTSYISGAVAKSNVFSETINLPPALDNAGVVLLAYICREGNDANFNDPTQAWIISAITSSGGGSAGGGGGIVDHTALTNRDAIDQHPIDSIGEFGGEQLRDYINDAVYQTPTAAQVITLNTGDPILGLISNAVPSIGDAFYISNPGVVFRVTGDGGFSSQGIGVINDGILTGAAIPSVGFGTGTVQINTNSVLNPSIIAESAGVAHGMTGLIETSVYHMLRTQSALGGIEFSAFGGEGFLLQSFAETANVSPGVGVIAFATAKKLATAVEPVGATELVFTIDNTARLLELYGNGDLSIAGDLSLGGTLSVADELYLTGGISTGGELAPDADFGGITINHGANDGYALTIKNSDVNQPSTNFLEADTYFAVGKQNSTTGGARLWGASSGLGIGMMLTCIQETESTNTQFAPIRIQALKSDGANGVTGITGENVAFTLTSTVNLFNIRGNGNIYSLGGIATGGETAPDATAGGITLKGTGARMTTYKSSNVAHPFTSLFESDTYGILGVYNTPAGGFNIQGITELARSIAIDGFAVTPNTGSNYGVVHVNARKSDGGTGVAVLASTENVFSVHSNSSTPLVRVTGDGTIYSDGGMVTGNLATRDSEVGGITLTTPGAAAMSFKGASVLHPFTSLAAADTYGLVRTGSSSNGGWKISGYAASSQSAIRLEAYTATPGSTAFSAGAYSFLAFNNNAGSGGSLANTNNLLTIFNNSLGVTTVKGNGDIFTTGGIATGGEVAPDSEAGGITILATSGGRAISIKDSAVAHGVTGYDETDTYGRFGQWNPSSGGLQVRGYTELDTNAVAIFGISVTEPSGDTDAIVTVHSRVKSGTIAVSPSNNANIFAVKTAQATPRLRLTSVGDLFLKGSTFLDGGIATGGETAPDGHLTLLNSTSNALTFKNPNVAHGMTAINETDTYGLIGPLNTTNGALQIRGLSNAGYSYGVYIQGIAGTTSSSNSVAPIAFSANTKSGTSLTAVPDADTAILFRNATTHIANIKGNGDALFKGQVTGKTNQSFSSTTTRTSVAADECKMVDINNASAITYTIDNNAHETNSLINIIQSGAGQITIAGTNGAVIVKSSTFNAKTANQYSVISAWKRNSTDWVLFGGLEVA